tara:strand:- start:645 stop:779 length:135 start_codon:yes stop_codon:yes gene_type:complete
MFGFVILMFSSGVSNLKGLYLSVYDLINKNWKNFTENLGEIIFK